MASSPYINQFSQPDSILPDLYNPQSLNRYAYTLNNPLRYTDPTGHRICEDIEGQCLSEKQATKKWISDHTPKPKPKKEPNIGLILKTGLGGDSCVDNACTIPFLPFGPWADWTTSSYPWSFPVYDSWGVAEIDPTDFDLMLQAVGDDLQSTITLGWYDTPFFDSGGDLTGIGCVNGSCYDRSELNYIGEGEALAKNGLSRDATQTVVFLWKNKMSLLLGLIGLDSTMKPVTQGTKDMTDIGWYYYTEHYSSNP